LRPLEKLQSAIAVVGDNDMQDVAHALGILAQFELVRDVESEDSLLNLGCHGFVMACCESLGVPNGACPRQFGTTRVGHKYFGRRNLSKPRRDVARFS
jgi:hypothetical protein